MAVLRYTDFIPKKTGLGKEMSEDDRLTTLLALYEERATHARQHQSLRTQIGDIIIALIGALIGVVTFVVDTSNLAACLIFTVIAVLSLFGWRIVLIHHAKVSDMRKEQNMLLRAVADPDQNPISRVLLAIADTDAAVVKNRPESLMRIYRRGIRKRYVSTEFAHLFGITFAAASVLAVWYLGAALGWANSASS